MPQQQRTTPGRSTSTARLLRGAVLAAGLALLPLATACGAGTDTAADTAGDGSPSEISAAPAAGVVAPPKVEVIAGMIGCESSIRTDADELREGTCHSAKADYLITTFPAEKFKLTWLDAASIYGGTYLVGPQWVVSAKPELLEQARDKVGGSLQTLGGMNGATPGPSAS